MTKICLHPIAYFNVCLYKKKLAFMMIKLIFKIVSEIWPKSANQNGGCISLQYTIFVEKSFIPTSVFSFDK